MESKNISTINVSSGTFIRLIIFAFIVFFLFLIKDILALIFVSLILASALDPWVDWLQKIKIPRALGITIIYIVTLSIAFLIIYLIVPPISQEITQIANHFPQYYDKIVSGLQGLQGQLPSSTQTEIQKYLMSLSSSIPMAISNIYSLFSSFFGGIFAITLVLVITFYLTVQEDSLKRFVRSICPSKYQPYVNQIIFRVQRKLGRWIRGQVILCFIVFLLDFIGLIILGVHYPLLLALLAGILEIVPFIGPIVAMVPAAFFGFLQSPITGLLVLILFIVVQQLESAYITPKVMSKSVDLNPLIVLLVILIGAKVGGMPGALVSVPVAAALSVFVSDFFDTKNNSETKLAEDD